MNKPNVIFLCTGNSARSQMAEAFLRHYADEQFNVFSAGLEPKGMNPFTVAVMQEKGFDMVGQVSKGVLEYLGRQVFQYVITVCDHADANCPTVWMGVPNRLHWSFEDPAAVVGSDDEKLAKFREVRNQIEARVSDWLGQLRDGA